LSAALDEAYAANLISLSQRRILYDIQGAYYPSSNSRKEPIDPESLDMNVIVPMGIRVFNNFCAVMIGPTALVVRCFE